MHVLGMLYTTDLKFGIHDLKIKLPLLVLPVIVFSSPKLSYNQLVRLLLLFVWSVFVATLISFGIYLGVGNVQYTDIRGISIIISQIRFSLYIAMAIMLTLYFLLNKDIVKPWLIIIYSLLMVWFTYKLMLFKSLTGVIILYVSLVLMCFYYVRQRPSKAKKMASLWWHCHFAGISFFCNCICHQQLLLRRQR
ncbi:MAG: hypothetical protein HC896_06850 [Bacteroidales bacterium]|nr:hypothetical protein [Bacteroidales bacterium]